MLGPNGAGKTSFISMVSRNLGIFFSFLIFSVSEIKNIDFFLSFFLFPSSTSSSSSLPPKDLFGSWSSLDRTCYLRMASLLYRSFISSSYDASN